MISKKKIKRRKNDLELEQMDKLTAYLTETIESHASWQRLESYAKENRVPIMEPVSMQFMLTLLQMRKPEHILEVGTAIGYSAMRMAATLPHAKITTIEKNNDMIDIAAENIAARSMTGQIEQLEGDAADVMAALSTDGEKYDFIFIDAAKGQYEHYFRLADQLLSAEGVIVCDNILFRGYVSGTNVAEEKRFQKLTAKLQAFNASLVADDSYKTSLVPIGDGMSISVKLA